MPWWETSQWKQHLDCTWTSAQLTAQGKHPASFTCQHHNEKDCTSHSHYAYISSCLVSNPYTIILMITLAHVSSLHNTRSHSPLNTILGKLETGTRLTVPHTRQTCHGYPPQSHRMHPLNRGLDILTQDTEHADIDQWQHPQFGCHSCLRRSRNSTTPWRTLHMQTKTGSHPSKER